MPTYEFITKYFPRYPWHSFPCLGWTQEQHAEYDFKGGAGAPCDGRRGFIKSAMKCVEQDSPQDSLEDDLTDSQNNVKESIEVTPTRHSARTAGKTFKYFLFLFLQDKSCIDNFITNKIWHVVRSWAKPWLKKLATYTVHNLFIFKN